MKRTILLCLAASASAAELDELLALPLDDLTRLKLTTSTMTEETLRTVPSAMTVYTREEIRRLGITELQQLITFVPGFQTARSDNWGIGTVFSNRGRPVSDAGRSILLLVDGERINNDVAGGPTLFDCKIPLDNVERVEFIRGPGSALYGTNAISGVINVITRNEHEMRVEVGNHAERAASAQWRFDGKDRSLEMFARGTTSHGESRTIFDPASAGIVQSADPYSAHDLSMRARLDDFTLSARNSHRVSEQFYIFGYVDNGRNRRVTDSGHINLDWHRNLNSAFKLEGSTWYSQRTLHLSTTTSAPLTGDLQERELGTQWLVRHEDKNVRWLSGVELRQPRVTRNANNYGTTGAENPRMIEGLFGQVQTELTHDLALTTGLRYDHYSDFGGHLSPRAGLVWQAMAQETFKLLYSEAFRAPTRSENSTYNSAVSASNPDLKPETAKTSEFIWLHQFDQGLFDATFFNIDVENAIVESVTPAMQRTWVNGQTSYRGLELEARYHWQNWQTRIATTRLFKVNDPGRAQSNNLLAGSLSYGTARWNAAILANYHSAMSDPNEQNGNISSTEYSYFGGTTLWSLHLGWNALRNVEYYLRGDNIFNRKVLYPADRAANYVGVPEHGRLVTVGLRFSFD